MNVPTDQEMKGQVPRLGFSLVTEACKLVYTQRAVWMTTALLYYLISITVSLLFSTLFVLLAVLPRILHAIVSGHPVPALHISIFILILLILQGPFQFFALGLQTILSGGMYRMALCQVRNQPIQVRCLFSALPESLPLLLIGGLLEVPLFVGRYVPRVGWVFTIVQVCLSAICMFIPLLVVDQKVAPLTAFSRSITLLKGQWLRAIWFYFVLGLLVGLGFLLSGVGELFLTPVFVVSISLAYLSFTKLRLAAVAPQHKHHANIQDVMAFWLGAASRYSFAWSSTCVITFGLAFAVDIPWATATVSRLQMSLQANETTLAEWLVVGSYLQGCIFSCLHLLLLAAVNVVHPSHSDRSMIFHSLLVTVALGALAFALWPNNFGVACIVAGYVVSHHFIKSQGLALPRQK